MAAQYNPKTLAKTLAYLLCHAPEEYGLHWDEDGSMPWKELYWAMQEDPSLRFVRESHFREIAYLGIEFPVSLEGAQLKLKAGLPRPEYPVADPPPSRLFHGCRRKSFLAAREHGLRAAGRPYLALSADRELSLRIARRRDAEPVLLEVLADVAARDGVVFRFAGGSLFLVASVPPAHIRFPLMSEEKLQELAGRPRKVKEPVPGIGIGPRTPGSFMMRPEHLQGVFGSPPDGGGSGKPGGKGRRGAEWKRASRKEREKRRP
jgi:putative RNA 2'-phosphotransferase